MSAKSRITRRKFLNLSLAGSAFLTVTNRLPLWGQTAKASGKRPNILFIITDQQGLETFSTLNNPYLHTPNLDRLKQSGILFTQSYSTNPVCSPARSSLFTGRMASETGVIHNGLAIDRSLPNLGQWLGQHGYRSVYAGKWHLPNGYSTHIPGFEVLPAGLGVRGTVGDPTVARVCEGFLRNCSNSTPFFLVASFLQPHDICNWIRRNEHPLIQLPVPGIESHLPPLPANFTVRLSEAKQARVARKPQWNELNWRYYLWSYYRMVEEVDREIGVLLNTLQDTGLDKNTLIVFTSDHGEGRARHGSVLKNFLYEEAVNVPLLISFPGRLPENVVDRTHLVSGLDVAATICDFAGIPLPPHVKGRSLKPLAEERTITWREFVVAEVMRDQGRMIRTERFKLIAYRNDPLLQLFDLQNDPLETRNLAQEAHYRSEVKALGKLLTRWEATLNHAPQSLGPFQMPNG